MGCCRSCPHDTEATEDEAQPLAQEEKSPSPPSEPLVTRLWIQLRKRGDAWFAPPPPRHGVKGVWRSTKRVNGDAFFRLLGMNYVLRMLVLRSTQIEVHDHDEATDAFTIVEKRFNGDYSVAFTVGQDFDYKTQSDEVCRSTSRWLQHEPLELELVYAAKEGRYSRRLLWDGSGMLETLILVAPDGVRRACMTTRFV